MLPRGIDLLYDIGLLLPNFKPRNILDVGANIGEVAVEYAKRFPDATIHCFEPVSSTFLRLVNNSSRHVNVHCFQLALSSKPGMRAINCNGTCSTLQPQLPTDLSITGDAVEDVELNTVDAFCRDNNIDIVDLLKIDTEGHDFEVLLGASSMLQGGMIGVLQVEVGLDRTNTKFVHFEKFRLHLESMKYHVFGFYEQVNEHYVGEPHLRRMDAVFVSDSVVNANRIVKHLKSV
jgi:FkbM family methyltransferase